jgi:hypothetical protein
VDASLRVRRIGAAPAGYARDSSPFRAAIPTELDSSQTVAAALDAPSATADDVPRNAPPLQPMPQDVLIDPQAREVMFRAMALGTGQTLEDTPEEAMHKLKAYTRAERKKRPSDGETVERTA